MKNETCQELLRLGRQKAILETPGNSDLRYHFGDRAEIHRSIGKLLYGEIESGRTQKEIISEASDFLMMNFPGVRGFSGTGIWRMIFTYRKYKDDPELEKMSKEVPVSQSIVIASMCRTPEECRAVLKYAVNGLQSKRKLEVCLRACHRNSASGYAEFFNCLYENSGFFQVSKELVFEIPEKEFETESVQSLIMRKIPDIKRESIRSGFVRIHLRED